MKNNHSSEDSDVSVQSSLNQFLLLFTKARSSFTPEQFAAFADILAAICKNALKDASENVPDACPPSATTSKLLGSLGYDLGAFERAELILKLAVSQGFQWPSREKCWNKVLEEVTELSIEIENDDKIKLQDELGDLFLTLISFADFEQLDAQAVLQQATDKFARRYQVIESEAASQNKTVLELTPSERESAWQKAKSQGL